MMKPFCFTCASISSTQSATTVSRLGGLPRVSTSDDIVNRVPRNGRVGLLRGLLERHAVAVAPGAHLLAIELRQPLVVLLRDHAVALDAVRRNDDPQHANIVRLLGEN